MLTAPRTTLLALAHQRVDPILPVLLYLVVVALGALRPLYRYAVLAEEAPRIALRNMMDVVVREALQDLGTALVAACVAGVLGRFFARPRATVANAACAASYLLVIVVVERALGLVLSFAGVDLWWMPHHAVDGPAVFANNHVVWARFATKCVVTYGLPAVILGAWAHAMVVGRAIVEPPAARARAGLGALLVLVITATVGAVADTAKVADKLRPALPGQPLLAEAMPLLVNRDARWAWQPSGSRVHVNDLRGSVVILDFWASWCAPCRRSIPELTAMQQELGPRGLRVLGVNREPHDVKAAREAYAALAPSFPSVVDDRNYGDRLGLTSLPTSYVLDRAGTLRFLHLGYVEPAVLRAEVEELLGAP
jgi:thiol-disulfide isomerase/thioredoxin